MDEIWANRLIARTKTWEEIPASRRKAVKEALAGRVNRDEITVDRYKEITGEKYKG